MAIAILNGFVFLRFAIGGRAPSDFLLGFFRLELSKRKILHARLGHAWPDEHSARSGETLFADKIAVSAGTDIVEALFYLRHLPRDRSGGRSRGAPGHDWGEPYL